MGNQERGKLSVHTENILPVIKKWLYSEKEIFLRELVSNALDAIQKVKKISMAEDIFQADQIDFAVDLKLDRENNILIIEDNGVGMTSDEVKKFIAQIAFSGAEEFVKKYESTGDKTKAGIIGNFGLGFYSAFMVAKKVEIQTRSWQVSASPVVWSSEGGEEYEIGEGSRENRGTEIRLHLDDEEKEFVDKARVSELIRKYCDFLPIPIRVDNSQVNQQTPLWTKAPSSLTKEDYNKFYNYLYPFQGDPLFYIHLNVDYPFQLQGVLFFPRLEHELDLNRSNVKIYCKQVFVTEEAQEVIPKFLTVLQGVIDLPELPLNVSRSYIQNDPQVKKIAQHIIKKVADRLNEELKNNRTGYEGIWTDIGAFVKFGLMSDDRFNEQASSAVLLEVISSDDEKKATVADDAKQETPKVFRTIDEYIIENKTKAGEKLFYATDVVAQGPAIRLMQKQGIEVVSLPALIDVHFIGFMESKRTDVKFVRVDAELSEHVIDSNSQELLGADAKSASDRLIEVFKKAINDEKVTIRVEALKSEDIPAMILLPEQMRRFGEMAAMMGQGAMPKLPKEHTVVLNRKNSLIQRIEKPSIIAEGSSGKNEALARQVYQLAKLSQGLLDSKELGVYVQDTYKLIETNL